jgi:hypothetical protein
LELQLYELDEYLDFSNFGLGKFAPGVIAVLLRPVRGSVPRMSNATTMVGINMDQHA